MQTNEDQADDVKIIADEKKKKSTTLRELEN